MIHKVEASIKAAARVHPKYMKTCAIEDCISENSFSKEKEITIKKKCYYFILLCLNT